MMTDLLKVVSTAKKLGMHCSVNKPVKEKKLQTQFVPHIVKKSCNSLFAFLSSIYVHFNPHISAFL